jgi:hypothetical protein
MSGDTRGVDDVPGEVDAEGGREGGRVWEIFLCRRNRLRLKQPRGEDGGGRTKKTVAYTDFLCGRAAKSGAPAPPAPNVTVLVFGQRTVRKKGGGGIGWVQQMRSVAFVVLSASSGYGRGGSCI